jgi:hypothetical protein
MNQTEPRLAFARGLHQEGLVESGNATSLAAARHAGLDPASTFSSGATDARWTPDQAWGDAEVLNRANCGLPAA